MNGRQLTDAQISKALRVHLPERAYPGLRERILEAAEATTQQRALPSVIGALSKADPMTRRRTLLIAAALLVAAVLASAAAVGALRLLQRDPVQDLSLEARPSLPGVVTPSSTPSLPSAGPTPSAVTSPTGVWIATGTMGTPRDSNTAVRLLDGRVLVAGGSDEENDTSTELYDPNSGTWSATGNMLKPEDGFPATLLLDGKVLLGDVDDPTVYDGIPGAEVYDPATGTWSSTGKLATTDSWTAASTATLLANGKVLVTGYDGAQLYDPDTGTWSATGKMVTPRYNHTATLLPDGGVLVAGGDVPPDLATDSAELYDPVTGSWTATANLRATGNPRFDSITATLLQDGTVLVVRSSTAEVYDPATGAWTATGELPSPGTAYRPATLLSDGIVLVPFSGFFPATPGSTVADLYDPDTRSWSTTAPMLRSHGTPAILLLDGTVLVAGGRDCLEGVCVATGSAELYVPRGVSPPTLPAFPSPAPPVFPTPTPIPTPFPPAAGPIPTGARPWTVTVVNKSPEPVTLFLAEEGENAMGPLCGSVTPNVVPAGVTEKVTFLLPPKTVKSCWIWVNPPPGGELFQTSDAPLAGEIFIQAGGPVGWVGP
ncbi:MAG: hypothetical protein E6I26_07430 [Chloroflexi bacterium]|nr:MAG: hypothetical protein E6I26_07430 [Chloroflexota bacterium]